MAERIRLRVEVPGLGIEYRGDRALFEEVVREVVAPVARGARRLRLAAEPEAPTPAAPAEGPASPGPAPSPDRALSAHAAPAAPSTRAAPPAPAEAPAAGGAAFDPRPLYEALAKEGARRAERDAVLLALVALAAAGKRDATPAEITSHLAASGFPTGDLKARPILAKLTLRKGLVAPGILPHTFRATPAGVAHILRRGRGA